MLCHHIPDIMVSVKLYYEKKEQTTIDTKHLDTNKMQFKNKHIKSCSYVFTFSLSASFSVSSIDSLLSVFSPSGVALTNRSPSDPPNIGFPEGGVDGLVEPAVLEGPASDVILVVEVSAVGRSDRCPGLGSSNSSTRPSADTSLLSNPPLDGFAPSATADGPSDRGSELGLLAPLAVGNCRGLIGGLRLRLLRASSCKNGIGENKGVVTSRKEPARADDDSESSGGIIGNASIVDVISKARSTARRYFPRYL